MTDTYTPMKTLREVKAWAKANGLKYRCGYLGHHGLENKSGGSILDPVPIDYFIYQANALRQWHEGRGREENRR